MGRVTEQTAPENPDDSQDGPEQASMAAAESVRGGAKANRSSPRPDVSYTPVFNGMDYLLSVFEHLTEGETPPSARDLKYTVLHLQAATEVLLKARLAREHFSLVFADPSRATYDDWQKGDFKSCSTLDAFDRLSNIVRISFESNDRKRIKDLSDHRNALQHYGLKGNAYAIESRAAKVLDFLITFIHLHLIPGLDPDESEHVEQEMESFRGKLRGIESLVEQRMNGLRSKLATLADVTVQCPDCWQWAMLAYNGNEGPCCLFCHQQWPSGGESAAVDYAWMVLGLDEVTAIHQGAAPPVATCPECGLISLVTEAVTAAGRPGTTPMCFGCGTGFEHLVDCEGGCDAVLNIAPDSGSIPMCSDCIDILFDRF